MPRGRKPNPNKVVRTNNLPSSPTDRKKLKQMISEAVDARTIIQSSREKFVDVREAILEEFPINSKLINKLIDFSFKLNADKVTAEWAEIAEAYEKLSTTP